MSADGEVFYSSLFGSLTYQGDLFNQPVTNQTLYDIASLSKVVAATTCAMKLYEAGKLSLDDKLIKYVPQANNNGKDAITVRNLLLHNAGFAPDYPFNDVYSNVTFDIFVNWVYNAGLDYPVGSKSVYSDVSMVALQLIIEKITG